MKPTPRVVKHFGLTALGAFCVALAAYRLEGRLPWNLRDGIVDGLFYVFGAWVFAFTLVPALGVVLWTKNAPWWESLLYGALLSGAIWAVILVTAS